MTECESTGRASNRVTGGATSCSPLRASEEGCTTEGDRRKFAKADGRFRRAGDRPGSGNEISFSSAADFFTDSVWLIKLFLYI